MTSVANFSAVPSFDGMTYQGVVTQSMQFLQTNNSRFEYLGQQVAQSIQELKKQADGLASDKFQAQLTQFLKSQYDYYQQIVEAQTIANQALTTLTTALAFCSPTNVALRPEQIAHMTRLGHNMTQYPREELSLAESSDKLSQQIPKLKDLISKTDAFVLEFRTSLNDAARFLKQTTRDPKLIDRLPSMVLDPAKYFDQGYQAYLQAKSATNNKTDSKEASQEEVVVNQ